MKTRKIGSLDVSIVGLGCNNFGWRIDRKATADVVNAALDSGINFFDTADVYGDGQSEEFLRDALRDRRNEIVLATKFGNKAGALPEYIKQAIENSLRRLGTDRIDLYQLHKPDPSVPISDTLGALDELVRAGKVREIGCSNFSGDQLRAADAVAAKGRARFVSVQNRYSLLHREPEAEVLPECQRLGVAFLPYYPLENGLLTGKYRRGQPPPQGSRGDTGWGPKVFTEENLEIVESLIAFAESRKHSLLELAFAWLLAMPVVASVIAGATSSQQVRTNARATEWTLSTTDLAEIDRLIPEPARA